MSDYNFEFERIRLFGVINYKEFMKNALSLKKLIPRDVNKLESKILSFENSDVLNGLNLNFSQNSNSNKVVNSKEYNLDEFNQSLWDRSQEVDLSYKFQYKDLMVSILGLKYRAENSENLIYYGKNVEKDLRDQVFLKFKKMTFFYPILFE